MPARQRYAIEHAGPDGELVALEPTRAEIVAHAGELAAAFNDAHNAAMMGHDEPFTEDDVIDHYIDLVAEGARPFFLFHDGRLAGDADLRDIDRGRAEFAIMVAARAAQGRGLGTRFAVMVHAFAFRVLRLSRVYVGILPGNLASRRLFTKLGYRIDDGPTARGFVESDDEVSMSVAAADLERAQGWLDEIRIAPRR